MCACVRGREREKTCACVSVCVRVCLRVCVCVCACVQLYEKGEREREFVCTRRRGRKIVSISNESHYLHGQSDNVVIHQIDAGRNDRR